ncbi:MAG TPA: hypothetical protein EYG68_09190 [Leucothrix mucor]|nr:hypothetical protein [Leucothrix mucor]
MLLKNLNSNYNPLYFLAALGAGGLAVTFFMYPNFMLPHKGSAMIHFAQIIEILRGDNLTTSILLSLALGAIAFLSLLHFRLLFWNISEYRKFKKTDAFKKLASSHREISLMVIPLTLAMSVNVSFILGAVFVPELWSVVEYLFPVAILAFLSIGIYALKILGSHFTRLFTDGSFSLVDNNNFSQMIAVFALSMISVGLAAPGAMSHYVEVNAIGMFFSIFFLSLAVLLLVLKFALGFLSIVQNGIDKQTSVSMWIMIPILTLMGITIIRLTMGLHHGFETDLSKPSFFILTAIVISLQIIIGMIGYKVMKKNGYIPDHSQGSDANAGSFALICPGVAFFVFGMFFLTFGLIQNGLVELMSPAFFVLLAPLVVVQIQTLRVFFRLTCKVTACGPCKVTLAV